MNNKLFILCAVVYSGTPLMFIIPPIINRSTTYNISEIINICKKLIPSSSSSDLTIQTENKELFSYICMLMSDPFIQFGNSLAKLPSFDSGDGTDIVYGVYDKDNKNKIDEDDSSRYNEYIYDVMCCNYNTCKGLVKKTISSKLGLWNAVVVFCDMMGKNLTQKCRFLIIN
jgi:hypothetical protein